MLITFCDFLSGWDLTSETATPPPDKFPEKPSPIDPQCDCQKESKISKDHEAEDMISFENLIHDRVYIKKDEEYHEEVKAEMERRRRRKRSIDLTGSLAGDGNITVFTIEKFPNLEPAAMELNLSKVPVNDSLGRYEYFYAEVDVPLTTLSINNLKHHTLYEFRIYSVRMGDDGKNTSVATIVLHRTQPIEEADAINDVKIVGHNKNSSHNIVDLTWTPPPDPNGEVLTYTIIYHRPDVNNLLPAKQCITGKEFEELNHIYSLNLGSENGNYSIQVVVGSFSGAGPESQAIFFRIENPSYTLWIVIGVLLLLILVAALCYFIYESKHGKKNHKLFAEVNPDYDNTPYIPDEYEIPRERVQRNQELGQGSFGMVYAGMVQMKEDDSTRIACAIKTVNDSVIEFNLW